jgi:hypothetical protein
MREWMKTMWDKLTGRKPGRGPFRPAVTPDARDGRVAVMAFTDGETCVATLADPEAGEGGAFTVSFSHRRPGPEGKWAGVLDVPAATLRGLKELADQADEYLESAGDDDE